MKGFILKDIRNYGLSQFYIRDGLCSVYENDVEKGLYSCSIVEGKHNIKLDCVDTLDNIIEKINEYKNNGAV